MQNIVILLCFTVIKFKMSEEYDGLIHALTRVFTLKHVQTVTAASTCWPPGDLKFHRLLYLKFKCFVKNWAMVQDERFLNPFFN